LRNGASFHTIPCDLVPTDVSLGHDAFGHDKLRILHCLNFDKVLPLIRFFL
jgi:hypothetical protein